MVVRTETERGVFTAIFRTDQEQEAKKLYEKMAKEACGKVAVVELLDNELNTLKIKLSYNNTVEL